MIETVQLILKKAVSELTGDWSGNVPVQIPPSSLLGDFSTPIAFNLAKIMKQSPKNIADKLSSLISDPLIASSDTSSGFLNIRLSDARLACWLDKRFLNGTLTYFKEKKESVQIEFVSANPTGPLHIGHARGAAVGDSLARILAKYGYDVQKEYYLNDRGRQMRLLGSSVKARIEGKELPEEGYQGSYISDIAKNLEDGTADEISQKAAAIILDGIKDDLSKFSVTFDNFFSEKKLMDNNELSRIVDILKKKQLVYEKDGALWFKSSSFGDDKDRVLIKSNGDTTYFASDICYHYNKFIVRKFDSVIDIVGADHHGYVNRMKAACEAIDVDRKRLSIILIQIVNLVRSGKSISMSTRAGKFVSLKELTGEVSADAARFLFLTRKVTSHLDFDIDIAKKKSEENPVFYVQYAYARIQSILSKADEMNIKYDKTAPQLEGDFGLFERSLMIELACYKNALFRSASNLDPFFVASYLMNVAKLFHQFYHNVKILGGKQDMIGARLRLCQIVSYIIEDGLMTLGISHPARM